MEFLASPQDLAELENAWVKKLPGNSFAQVLGDGDDTGMECTPERRGPSLNNRVNSTSIVKTVRESISDAEGNDQELESPLGI